MIDTHAHLNSQEYRNQVEKIVSQSKKAGLTRIIIASSNLEDSQQAIDLVKKYPGYLYASVGIHPHEVITKYEARNTKLSQTWLTQIEGLQALIEKNREYIVAVGETGLDDSELQPRRNSPDGEKAPRPQRIRAGISGGGGQALPVEKERLVNEQKELFTGQLELAAKYDLPVIIHARGFVDEVINSIELSAFGLKLDGVFHCYAGGKKRISKILNLPGDWYFGVDGNVTYDQGLQNVVAEIPRNRLVLETDSPWLTPEPHREEMNTPAYLPLVAAQIAEIWGVDQKEVDKIAVENTQRLFKL